ncbi:UDP-N-acetylmuramoyl-L-alanyl-D-glutamate--2,6-diaminopimelate ligase [Methylocystis sp. WRRC1]|uniref:UDP-N-acetylmuramoyl-L-alanyl-D-glutamate--2, 6-diaminopimelate ligase n=1 Tax=Methylocystis sp. WRRC1 TaxID=1732014 RepID=UPI001D149A43|nr:UDP-N-acetylmuramoyl-L-alanyl-D-glutamate--2,6-diaminopimelate ligase [Methylocystis sp. WRRC1]MCC3246528.1 UDP-N-acetylmuramoyl-L-alanyl-D-glutamate--2,6-diaminopimelate ligase [Methylocystis sp. WRRC1]
MRLTELLARNDLDPALAGIEIAGLSADSRAIREGFAFFAIPGHAGDGLSYVDDARARGARVVVAQRQSECSLPLVVVDDVRAELAHAAARFHPRQPRVIAAVTGTSGKTSVVAFLRQIWTTMGHEAASLGTVGVVDSKGAHYGALTTPGPVELHRILDELAGRGVTHLAMEASSLGIDQRRLDGVRLSVAGFTNFSRDHLDHHRDMEEYFAAKMRLFDTLSQPGRTAVIDADSDVAPRVAAVCEKRGLNVFGVGAKGEAIAVREARAHALATSLKLRHAGVDYSVELPLAGAFQTSNALVAAGLAIAAGDDPARVFSALNELKGAPGRLEFIGERDGAPVFVDYAHKPDALEKVLATLRPLTKRRLIVVFGCGGDRDRGKRPLMGEIAARAADVAIVTDDNPRSEDANAIRAAIIEGARGGGAEIIEIADRGEAISKAVADLRAGDVLVVAGKGHETGQIVGDRVLPFSDHEAIAQALQEHRS